MSSILSCLQARASRGATQGLVRLLGSLRRLHKRDRDFVARGDGTVTVWGRPPRVPHCSSSFGMEAMGRREKENQNR